MKHIALISEHASPLAAPGSVDSGGQNVYVAQMAANLADRGYAVDVFTRRDSRDLPEIVPYRDRVRIIHVPAGPPHYIRKEDLLPHMNEFSKNMIRFCAEERAYDIVHANFWMSGLVALNVKRMLGIPFVVTFHALGRIRRRDLGRVRLQRLRGGDRRLELGRLGA
jgi:glycosyltransferase involved in cell wall biosynthesis